MALVLAANFEFAKTKIKMHCLGPFPRKGSIWKNPNQLRTSHNDRFYLKTILPYNKVAFCFPLRHGWSAGFEEIKMPYIKSICPNA